LLLRLGLPITNTPAGEYRTNPSLPQLIYLHPERRGSVKHSLAVIVPISFGMREEKKRCNKNCPDMVAVEHA
jgi:hypothetical protein